jgi:ATP-dependent Clp protease adaptor protein ClpS
MIGTLVQPKSVSHEAILGRWKVVIFDNDTNSMNEVVEILMRATGCTEQEAGIEMWEAHTFGRADVHFGKRGECDRAAGIISSIGVKTEVAREWEES